jgi:hypothetical protein
VSKAPADNKIDIWVLRESLTGAYKIHPRGRDKAGTKVNYFKGRDKRRWKTNIPTYNRLALGRVYDGIELSLKAYGKNVEKIFTVHPTGKVSDIRLKVEGISSLKINPDGELEVNTGSGSVRFSAPVAFQEIEGERNEIRVAYDVNDNTYGFHVDEYDRRFPLIIDPSLSYSTYLCGRGEDNVKGIAVDGSGNAYVTGWTESVDFPLRDALQGSYNGGNWDAFVTKLNAAGDALVYSTYLGGSGGSFGNYDWGFGIAVDSAGNAYISGGTDSPNFPTMNAYDSTVGGNDVFVTKLNAAGDAILYSTYLGGPPYDQGGAIAVDGSGNAYVSGHASDSFPTKNAYQSSYGGGSNDVFFTVLDTNLSGAASLIYSTYLGGSGLDYNFQHGQIAVDSSGNAYLTGFTESAADFPTKNPYQPSHGGGTRDAFVAKFDPSQSGEASLVYSTYLGGSGPGTTESGRAITVDGSGNAYVVGYTNSDDFPTLNAFQGSLNGTQDGFLTKLNAAGNALVYSTYLGGSSTESCNGIRLDGLGNAYVAGFTRSTDFPVQNPIQGINAGGADAFVAKLNAAGNGLFFSTYLGGSNDDSASGGIALDGSGNAYITGFTESADFPTLNPFQESYAGNRDAFVAKLINLVSPGIYYVDINRTSEGDGSALTPWKTLHYALQEINSGPSGTYTLNAAAGTYNVENGEADATLVINQDNVTIQGGEAGTIISGSGASTWQIGIEINASNVTISGCEVSNFTMNGINIYTGTGQTVEHCDIHDNDWGIYTNNTSPEIRKNKIYDNTRGIYLTVFDGLAYAPVVKNNLIYDTDDTMEYGIEVYAASTGSTASHHGIWY